MPVKTPTGSAGQSLVTDGNSPQVVLSKLLVECPQSWSAIVARASNAGKLLEAGLDVTTEPAYSYLPDGNSR